jgi:hypothetical protein
LKAARLLKGSRSQKHLVQQIERPAHRLSRVKVNRFEGNTVLVGRGYTASSWIRKLKQCIGVKFLLL